MRRVLIAIAIAASAWRAPVGQERPKPLGPSRAKTDYSFPLKTGSAPFHFTIQLDSSSTVTGFLVFRPGELSAFQTVPACKVADGLTMELNEYDEERELLVHQDLNFDGFEDVELLQYFVPHLATSIYCVYTWSAQEGRFRYAPEIPNTNPIANPANKTITMHQDYFGGVFIDRTYRLSNGKPQLVVENGRVSGSSRADCGFTDYCSRLVNRKMVTTVQIPSTCDHDEPAALVCPSIVPTLPSAQPKK